VTLLAERRPSAPAARAQDRPHPNDSEAVVTARPVMTRRQFSVLMLILAVLLGGTLALVFGPARGMRTDIVNVSDDLDASRDGIFLQLNTARTQLGLTEQSLEIQETGLEVAMEAERDTTVAAQSTRELLEETRATLQLVREVTRSLGPDVGEKVDMLVKDVEQAVALARQTLAVAQQTLATGQQALAVARDTLATLKRSEQIQIELLKTAKEINRKIPFPPVFPESPATPAPVAP
jgi:ribosome-binding protein aMBF1 (putative translation factor)